MKIEPTAEIRIAANAIAQLVEALQEQGFTKQEALLFASNSMRPGDGK